MSELTMSNLIIDIDVNSDGSQTDVQINRQGVNPETRIISGTNDYNELINKPSIDGNTLVGDKPMTEFMQPLTNDEIDDILRD